MDVKQEIKNILEEKLTPTFLEVQDDSGRHKGHREAKKHGGGHYNLKIVTEAFKDKSRIQRHRMVYDLLAPLMTSHIHALAMQTLTLEESNDN